MAKVQLITNDLFQSVAEKAMHSPRLRMNHNFHSHPSETVHRFLNVLLQGTYVRPHRHIFPPKSETLVLLEGELDLITFENNGAISGRSRLSGTSGEHRIRGADIAAGIWHTVVVVTEHAVCFEVKPGPWTNNASDKDFAPWAPTETNPAASSYLVGLTR
jgi:cupin fold WbuC family metalloprotein